MKAHLSVCASGACEEKSVKENIPHPIPCSRGAQALTLILLPSLTEDAAIFQLLQQKSRD
jgi:hypothetical protein